MNTLTEKIKKLKKEKNVVILAHAYQNSEIQDVADYVGDSLGLSRVASKTEADIIVFCGVLFMAETAKILSPDKRVFTPKKSATCPMANMIKGKDVRELRTKYDNSVIVGYVNTSAEVKAEVDICCTSGNAIEIVNSLDEARQIIFIPDKYLGGYVAKQTGRNLVLWNGYCPTHIKILPEHIERMRKKYPKAEVLVHPECLRDVSDAADKVCSTGGMCEYVKKANCQEFIIGTEVGFIHKLYTDNPDKKFYNATDLSVCPNMKKIKLEDVLWALEEEKYEIILDSDIIERAQRSVFKMIETR